MQEVQESLFVEFPIEQEMVNHTVLGFDEVIQIIEQHRQFVPYPFSTADAFPNVNSKCVVSESFGDYHINVFWSEEDGQYVADIPDLAYCSAMGATPEEALSEVLIAKRAWLESAAEAGKAIPRPQYRGAFQHLGGAPSSDRLWPAAPRSELILGFRESITAMG